MSSSPLNQPPEISVISPSDLDEFCECETVDFEGTSTDPESGDLTASLDWDSSLDGTIGSGGMFSTNDLSVGDHTITVSVSDGENPVAFKFDLTITAEGPYGNTFVDDDGSIFEQDIEWMFAEGITSGCPGSGPVYCPANTVTRAQMATFLVAAFDLPPVAGNKFSDVSGVHTANINALAEAGITVGCNSGGTLFCPSDSVTRAQMGTFLAKALKLTPIAGHVFDDVSGVHEANINAIAALGITTGCSPSGNTLLSERPCNSGSDGSVLAQGVLRVEPATPARRACYRASASSLTSPVTNCVT